MGSRPYRVPLSGEHRIAYTSLQRLVPGFRVTMWSGIAYAQALLPIGRLVGPCHVRPSRRGPGTYNAKGAWVPLRARGDSWQIIVADEGLPRLAWLVDLLRSPRNGRRLSMNELLLVGLAGFCASLVDGALGMGFGPTSSSIFLGAGLSPASVSRACRSRRLQRDRGRSRVSGPAAPALR